jgi:hypothetical protein
MFAMFAIIVLGVLGEENAQPNDVITLVAATWWMDNTPQLSPYIDPGTVLPPPRRYSKV